MEKNPRLRDKIWEWPGDEVSSSHELSDVSLLGFLPLPFGKLSPVSSPPVFSTQSIVPLDNRTSDAGRKTVHGLLCYNDIHIMNKLIINS